MNYTLEVIVRVIGPDGVPVDDRGRPCDEVIDQISAHMDFSKHVNVQAGTGELIKVLALLRAAQGINKV